MRLALSSFGAFLLGTLVMGLIAQNRAPVLPPLPPTLQLNASTPIVPVPPRSVSSGNINDLQVIQLDGRNSEDETFRNSLLIYAGGAYSLKNPNFQGNIQIAWVGAADNTRRLLEYFKMTGCPAPTAPTAPHRFDPNTPRLETTSLGTALTEDLVSPYSGTK